MDQHKLSVRMGQIYSKLLSEACGRLEKNIRPSSHHIKANTKDEGMHVNFDFEKKKIFTYFGIYGKNVVDSPN